MKQEPFDNKILGSNNWSTIIIYPLLWSLLTGLCNSFMKIAIVKKNASQKNLWCVDYKKSLLNWKIISLWQKSFVTILMRWWESSLPGPATGITYIRVTVQVKTSRNACLQSITRLFAHSGYQTNSITCKFNLWSISFVHWILMAYDV